MTTSNNPHDATTVLHARIAELEQALAERTRETQTSQALLDQSRDGMALLNMDDVITYANPAFQSMSGYGKHVVGQTIAVMSTPQGYKQLTSAGRAALPAHGAWQAVVEQLRPDGTTWLADFSATIIRDATGQIIGTSALFRDITIEQAQAERLRVFEALAASAPDAVVITSMQGVISYSNAAFRALLGADDGAVGQSIDTLLASQAEEIAAMQAAVAAQGVWRGLLTYRHVDGTLVPTEATLVTITDATGRPLERAGILRDLTAQQAQAVRLQLFETLAAQAQDGISMATPDRVIRYANAAFGRMTDYGERLVGMNFLDLYPPDVQVFLQKEAALVIRETGQWQGTLAMQRADGTRWWVQMSAFVVVDADGEQVFVAMTRDVTAERTQANRLHQFELLARDLPDGIAITTLDSIFIYTNPAFQTMTGYSEALDGMSFAHLLAPESIPIVEAIQPLMIAKGAWQGEVFYQHQDGTIFPVAVSVALMRDNDGQQHMVAVVRDMRGQRAVAAERAALQQQVIDAQSAALRELSTPLIPVADEVVVMPLVGTLDTERAEQVMETLLNGIVQYQAAFAILDVTGVRVVDTQVAQALVRAAQAARLLGTTIILTGIGAEIAQTLGGLGADLAEVITRSTLQSGIMYARDRQGVNGESSLV